MKPDTPIHVGGRKKICPSEIIFLESDVNYTKLHLTDGSSFLVSTTLGKLEPLFASLNFFRPNRSLIINLEYLIVAQIDAEFSFFLPDDREVSVSRRRKQQFIKSLNLNF